VNRKIFIISLAMIQIFFSTVMISAEDIPAAVKVGAQAQESPPKVEAPAPPAMAEEPAIEPGSITVNFKGADIRTVLSYIAEVSGVDIVPAPDVKGPVDLKLTNKPWKVALDIIVRNYGFAYEREGNIIRVDTVDKLKQQEVITQTYNLNYAVAKDVVDATKDMLSERGKIVHDTRTNMLLVTDVPTNIYKISQVVEKLDSQTPQVLIEARIIETVLGANEKMGIDWSMKVSVTGAKRPTTIPFEAFKTPFNVKQGEADQFFPQVLTASPNTVTTQSGGQTTSAAASSFPSDAAGIFSFPFADKDAFTFGTLDFTQFSAVLEMLKERANTEIVSNPRIATLNNKEASIQVGTTLGPPTYERNSTTGKMEITGYESKDLGIKLKVTPHINTKEEITIEMAPEISDLLRYDTLDAASGVKAPVFSTRVANTQVMVRDGETIFIGGLIKENNKDYKKKLPIIGDLLGDVPYLGLLFSKKETVKEKTELIFFITVHIVTPNKAIKDLPNVAKAYLPSFTLYEEKNVSKRRRLKKKID